MRIAWVTPLARRSGIAKYSLPVVRALAEKADVEVWAPSVAEEQYECPWASVRDLDAPDAAERLRGYDAVYYNMGDHPGYHGRIFEAYMELPGLVVLHDKRMHGFVHNFWALDRGEPERYAALMAHYYGSPGAASAARILRGEEGLDDDERFPLLEPCLYNALGAVAHSDECADLALARYGDDLPVISVPLPFDLETVMKDPLPSRADLGVPADKLLVVSHGGVAPQKRLDTLIHAFSDAPPMRNAHLAIVGGGDSEYIGRLQALARDAGIADRVTFTRFVDDATMYGWIKAADICVNLRYPSIESSSLTLVEQLFFGKPVIVHDTSYYAELPDDVVVKVRVADDLRQISAALERLARKPEQRRELGERALRFAEAQHRPGRYADLLIAFADWVSKRGC